MWHDPLKYEITGFLEKRERKEHPHLEFPDTGMLINVADLGYEEDVLSFRLLLTYQLSRPFIRQFQRFERALVFSFENAETGQAAVGHLVDPFRRFPELSGPNFKAAGKMETPATVHVKGWLSLPFGVLMGPPMNHPAFYITVSLQQMTSNTLALDLDRVEVHSFKEGSPFVIPFDDLSKDD